MSISTTEGRRDVAPEAMDTPGPVIDLTTGTSPSEVGGGEVLEAAASVRPTFTITDAASACSVSRKTITRKLPELAIHGAAKDDDGVWRIPVEALLAVGLHPGRSLPQAPVATRTTPVAPLPVRDHQQDTVTIPRDRWDDVRIRLARAEAAAAERALALADARLALRALTAGPATPGRAQDPVSRHDAPHTQPVSASGDVAPLTPEGRFPGGGTGGAPITLPDSPTGDASTRAGNPIPTVSDSATIAPAEASDPQAPVSADVIAARNLATRTGGYVPAGAAPAKKRRWWQSR
jgi:hypothetical protein